MGTPALEIVRFRRRYYVRYHHFDGYYEGVGADIVASIPADPDEYQKWLESMRAKYASRERDLEPNYEIGASLDPDSQSESAMLPSELPKLDDYGAQFFYIINLDHEVLTMSFGIHWKLGNIPRQDDLWLRSIVCSIYDYDTISADLCPEEHMASLALELPDKNQEIGYPFRIVTPSTDIKEAHKVFLRRALADMLGEYRLT